MPRWRWFQRANGQLDVAGPATGYLDRRGAFAPGYMPERPGWADEPTEERPAINRAPLMTTGAEHRAASRRRP